MGDTTRWLAQYAWLDGDTLDRNVLIEVEDGRIKSVAPNAEAGSGSRLAGIALPGLVNTHSHAFHRLLRGRTHDRGGDFWAWRDLMYEIASEIEPESYESLATAVFTEMALAGVTTVGEFHYLHHQPGGNLYEDPNEMGHALIRAARAAGIRICLLDAGYLRPGFGDDPLDPVQERFSDGNTDRWLDRVEDLSGVYDGAEDVTIGLAPHSVRAVPEVGLARLGERRDPDAPVHIHVSEQPAENQACLEATGSTPAGLLDRSGILGPGTTAIHGTHLTAQDIELLGSSGTGVCYCATTERDLADGIGPSGDLREAGVPLSVGSDSHAVIDLFEEMRGLELHERLSSGRRGLFSPDELLVAGTDSGATSLGVEAGSISSGRLADFIVISADTPRTAGRDLSPAGVVFAATSADVTDVIVGGRRIVTGRHHPGWESARAALEGLSS